MSPSSTKRVFISDIHLGPPDNPQNWYKKDQHDRNLVGALEDVAGRADEVKDLVLLGDLCDTWVVPVDKEPPGISAILEHHENVMEAVGACVEALENVFYLNGNHDMHLTAGELETHFGERAPTKIRQYNAGLLYAEHGHRFAMFNAPDKMHDTVSGLPLGYFICRMLSSTDNQYDSPAAFLEYVDDIMDAAFTSETLVESVVEAIMERAGLEPDTTVKMPRGRRDITIQEVKQRYAPLYRRWVEKFGQWYALHSARAELGSLNWFADRLARDKDYKVVVLGHTHDSQLDEDMVVFDDDRVYANSGYWCTDQPTMVEVDKRGGGSFEVSLYRFNDGERQSDPVRREVV